MVDKKCPAGWLDLGQRELIFPYLRKVSDCLWGTVWCFLGVNRILVFSYFLGTNIGFVMAQTKYPQAAKIKNLQLCEPLAKYCADAFQSNLFNDAVETSEKDIKVIELFAGVGGFRIGLERASKRFKTVWNNQWEPSTKTQDASNVYKNRFGVEGHSNDDISKVPVEAIRSADLLVGGFPCQDYSVASTLNRSGCIEGKKGVLWWEIYRILSTSKKPPKYLFLENVDRLLKSPAKQRGRDFAIILASLSDLDYDVEWRVINAADYGMPQRRRRTYIVAYKSGTKLSKTCRSEDGFDWILEKGVIADAFKTQKAAKAKEKEFDIVGSLVEVTQNFNKGEKNSPFFTAGVMRQRKVYTVDVESVYDGPRTTLGELLVDEKEVPNEFFIDEKDFSKWEYLKGGKSEKRKTAEGFEYNYSEGPMAFPDYLDRPSRTIITGEGGKGPSRFKHVIKTKSGRFRRLTPVELERLNMFPDNHTAGAGVSDMRRAFLMGNALVTGIVTGIGSSLLKKI